MIKRNKIIFLVVIISLIIVSYFLITLFLIPMLSPPKDEDDEENAEIFHQNPCWSPDGSQILFSSTETSDTLNLWVMNNDSSNSQPLLFNGKVDNEAEYVNLPGGAWCTATDEICFSSDRVDNDEIWYVQSNRASLVRITNNVAKDWEPSWSPDGEWVVFQSDRTGNWDLFKIRKDGTNLEQLTNNLADDWQPCWSPDGSKILFQSDKSGNWQLYTIDNSSIEGNLQNLSNDPTYEDTDASWNPYGNWIVFSSDRSENDADIYIMKSDGSSKKQITDTPEYNGAPSFAPDNRTIAFESLRSGEMRLWLLNTITFSLIQLTE